jgi:hypothetical protein
LVTRTAQRRKFAAGTPTALFHTGAVAIDAVAQQVGELLDRAHTLFADPAAANVGGPLVGAGEQLHTGHREMTALAGRLADGHRQLSGVAHAELTTLSDHDEQLGSCLERAADTDRAGRAASDAVRRAAATELAALIPLSGTAAGQRALLSALRTRVARQQRIIADTGARAGDVAAAVRALSYQPTEVPGDGR